MEQDGISIAQIRAGRALIGWTQARLAEAVGVATMTIKRAEGSGSPAPSAATLAAIRAALEAAGVVFLAENGGGAGVRLSK